jgi:hypothetical protein
MRTDDINWPAVRAFRRIMVPISDSHDEAARWDAGFDGGEFSGPAHDRMLEEEYQRVLEIVAGRFGIEPADLENMTLLADYHQWNCFLHSIAKFRVYDEIGEEVTRFSNENAACEFVHTMNSSGRDFHIEEKK